MAVNITRSGENEMTIKQQLEKCDGEAEQIACVLGVLQGLVDASVLIVFDEDHEHLKDVVSISLNGPSIQLNVERRDTDRCDSEPA